MGVEVLGVLSWALTVALWLAWGWLAYSTWPGGPADGPPGLSGEALADDVAARADAMLVDRCNGDAPFIGCAACDAWRREVLAQVRAAVLADYSGGTFNHSDTALALVAQLARDLANADVRRDRAALWGERRVWVWRTFAFLLMTLWTAALL